MLFPSNISDRLKELLQEKFPEEEVHQERCPSGFSRPCNLIEQGECSVDISMGTKLIEMRPTFTITTFSEVDEHYHSHLATLHQRQMQIVSLLLPSFIKVGDRAPKVAAIKLDGDYDYDTVTVTFSYTLDRREFEEIKLDPTMGELHLNEEVRTYG